MQLAGARLAVSQLEYGTGAHKDVIHMRHLGRGRHTRDARPQHVPRAHIIGRFGRNVHLEGAIAWRAHLVDPQLQHQVRVQGVQRLRQRLMQIVGKLSVREVNGATLDIQHGVMGFQWRRLLVTKHHTDPAECVLFAHLLSMS